MDEVEHHQLPDDEIDVGYASPSASLYRQQQHQKSTSSASSSLYTIPNDYRFRYQSGTDDDHQHAGHDLVDHDLDSKTPSLLSSPSAASSLGFTNGLSPLRRELSPTSLQDDEPRDNHNNINNASPTASPCPKGAAAGLGLSRGRTRPRSHYERDALARRLSQLAQQLTAGEDDFDDVGVGALTAQLDQMEKSMSPSKGSYPHSPAPKTPLSRQSRTPQRPASLDMRSRSDFGGGSLFSTPGSTFYRSRFSEISASIFRDREAEEEEEEEEEEPPKTGMTVQQANKVIAEATKLNDELSKIVNNLKARQEESDVSKPNQHDPLYLLNLRQHAATDMQLAAH